MNPEDAPVLDPLSQRIDAALRQEPPAPLPGGFHGALRRRLRIAALIQRERRVFLRRLLRVAALSVLAAAVAVSGGLYWDMSGTFLWEFPGFLGYVDYLAALTNRVWWLSGSPALLVSFGAVVMTLLVAGAFVGVFRQPVRSRLPFHGPVS